MRGRVFAAASPRATCDFVDDGCLSQNREGARAGGPATQSGVRVVDCLPHRCLPPISATRVRSRVGRLLPRRGSRQVQGRGLWAPPRRRTPSSSLPLRSRSSITRRFALSAVAASSSAAAQAASAARASARAQDHSVANALGEGGSQSGVARADAVVRIVEADARREARQGRGRALLRLLRRLGQSVRLGEAPQPRRGACSRRRRARAAPARTSTMTLPCAASRRPAFNARP